MGTAAASRGREVRSERTRPASCARRSRGASGPSRSDRYGDGRDPVRNRYRRFHFRCGASASGSSDDLGRFAGNPSASTTAASCHTDVYRGYSGRNGKGSVGREHLLSMGNHLSV
ncbi:MAG: hypothetical protein QG650_119 [Patescibacteria group bacterium]|nr:hypothetical protein [Patescibacteria group bacterium]